MQPSNATNQNVTWSSDKPEVATVDANGKVTAKAAGTATITVTTEDGKKTATCTVTVEKPYTPAALHPAHLRGHRPRDHRRHGGGEPQPGQQRPQG